MLHNIIINKHFLTHNWEPCQAEPLSLTFILQSQTSRKIDNIWNKMEMRLQRTVSRPTQCDHAIL